MFSHYGIVIAINLITVALKLAGEHEASLTMLCVMMLSALVLYFVTDLVVGVDTRGEWEHTME